MPIFKNNVELRFKALRLFLRVEVGLTGLGSVLKMLRSRPETDEKPHDVENSQAVKPAKGHPFDFRPGTHDRAVFLSVNEHDEYRLPATFQASDVIVDIGTHIGSFCYAALKRGSNNVHGFEAEESNYARASENLRSFDGRVRLRNKAVWRSDETVDKLTFTPSTDEANTAGGNVWSDGAVEVDAVPFDEVMKEVTDGGDKRVRMLKVDCEGSEFPILFTSRSLHLVDDIRGEYHEFGGEHDEHVIPEAMKVEGYERFTIAELTDVLQRAGFDVTSVRHGDSNMGLFFATRKKPAASSTDHTSNNGA